MDNQFWPTPPALVDRMYDLFERSPNSANSYLLEPSAGRGALVLETEDRSYARARLRARDVDAVEIDFENAAVLREHGIAVVGTDFLQFEGRRRYTHILMNPPFKHGARHVLHAIDLLRDGELVALLNAETLRNPCDQYRQRLVALLDKYGASVEYIEAAFTDPDAMRKTSVECALVHLKKEAVALPYGFLDELTPEIVRDDHLTTKPLNHAELAIKQDSVREAVSIFNAAVKALEHELLLTDYLQGQSSRYAGMLAKSLLNEEERPHDPLLPLSSGDINSRFNERYDKLKERAWSHILTATRVGKQLSSGAMNRLMNQFNLVCAQEFNEFTIYSFLSGLVAESSNMQIEMLCDLFDHFTGWHTENRAHYKHWKSNDKHKTNAYRLKTTRFIIPVRTSFGSISFESERQMRDFDLGFSLLAGDAPGGADGLAGLVSDQNPQVKERLYASERMRTRYFEVRFYPGVGSMHFYPRDKALVDRLSRLVGQHRGWLPPEDVQASESFWAQYQHAEKIQRVLDKDPEYRQLTRWGGGHTEKRLAILKRIEAAGESLGLDMSGALEGDQGEGGFLLSA